MDKYRLVVNPYDLEKWVNDMASQGWHLKKFTWIRFTFERGDPGSYIYRHDELERNGTSYEDEYLFKAVTLLNLIIGFINLYIGLGQSTERFLNTGVSFFNFVVVIIMYMHILKVEKRKKGLQRELHIFEG